MPINFPISPALNQTYSFGGKSWTWNGTGWVLVSATNSSAALTTFTPAGNIAATDVQAALVELDSEKQAVLVSGTNIKTINGASVLGAGDIVVATVIDAVKAPENVSPAQGATNVSQTETLVASQFLSLYGEVMSASQWQLSETSDFAVVFFDSGEVAGVVTSYTLPPAAVLAETLYYWRVRYKDVNSEYSVWSAPTSYSTIAAAADYIANPEATPADYGDAFQGGYYAGLIWNQVEQSSTSSLIETGEKAFVVPDMAATPIVYAGQVVEVRSRANPANKMVGTVSSAAGPNLTITVTGVGGAGTFTDWSIMARYRIIVAPKATGENSSIRYKSTNSAAPTACRTLTEGRKATLAMVAAGTSTVYPAAHWCNNLNIAGKTDWYYPARDEMELCRRNLKPGTDNNSLTARTDAADDYQTLGALDDTSTQQGVNSNSSPVGAAYTTDSPAQVAAGKNFRTGETEAFASVSLGYYSTSSELGTGGVWVQGWISSDYGQINASKTEFYRVRAARRSII